MPRQDVPVSRPALAMRETAADFHAPPDPVEAELAAWRAARRRRLPWRQIYLMAALCFGAASFVLSDSVNAALDGLLGILSLMSVIAWWRGRSTQG